MSNYVITASNPDGSTYREGLSLWLHEHGGVGCSAWGAYSDADRDRKVAKLKELGLTPHVRIED
jgi:hypothetical protein